MSKKEQNQEIPMHLPLAQVSGQVEPEIKPTWRGWIHTGVLPITIAAGIVLVVLADGVPAKIASAVFFASSVLLFGTSALYHRFNWGPKAKITLKRIDHSNIFLLIAGSYTPISWLALLPLRPQVRHHQASTSPTVRSSPS